MNVAELQSTERRMLKKFAEHADVLRAENPGMTRERAMSLAIQRMPNCYSKYCSVRGSLARLRVGPLQMDE